MHKTTQRDKPKIRRTSVIIDVDDHLTLLSKLKLKGKSFSQWVRDMTKKQINKAS